MAKATNLLKDFGMDYVAQMCLGAWIRVGDNVHCLRRVFDDKYLTISFDLNDPTGRLVSDELPHDAIKGLASFQYPKLGYREIMYGENTKQVVQLYARRSAMRGLRPDSIVGTMLPIYGAVHPDMYSSWDELSPESRIMKIYKPEFTNFAEGTRGILSGDYPAFAVNEDIAVTSAFASGADRAADILFRGKIVGSIVEDGHINLSNKIVNRASLLRHFEV